MSHRFQVISKSRPNFAAGMFLVIFGAFFGGIPLLAILNSKDTPGFVYIFPAIGFLLACLGFKFLMTSTGLDVDTAGGTLRQWNQFLFKRTEQNIALSDVSRVHLTTKIIRTSNSNGSSSSKTVYPVSIELTNGRFLAVETCNSPLPARARGESTAKLLEVSLADDTSGNLVERDHDKLDETVGQRLLREKAEIELKSPPANSGLNFDTQESKGVITIPKAGMAGMIPAFIMAVVGVFFVAIICLLGGSGDSLFIGLFMGLPIALVVLGIIWDASFARLVEIDRSHLILRQDGTLGRKLGKIAVEELEELMVAGNTVLARGDRGSVKISMFQAEEAYWVKEVLEYILLQMEKSPSIG